LVAGAATTVLMLKDIAASAVIAAVESKVTNGFLGISPPAGIIWSELALAVRDACRLYLPKQIHATARPTR
jgi:hypothetical protein